MKKKIFVFVITLLISSTSIIIPRNINVAAEDNYGDPDIDHEYILNRTYNLSQIIFYPDCIDWGRFFGTKGEQEAAENIEYWMENLSLDCVHLEKINSSWTFDAKILDLIPTTITVELNNQRVMKTFYLNISVTNWFNGQLIEYKNLSNTQCFPYYQHQYKKYKEPNYKNDSGHNILVVEKFSRLPLPQMELCDTHYSKHYQIFDQLENYPEDMRELIGALPWYRGYIAIDNDSNAFFQSPPYYQGEWWRGLGESQGFYVNGSIGEWIRENIENPYRRVWASYETKWVKEDRISYNVIGQINGSDTSKINIVGAHYDAMPGQGTIDEAAETALVLGIAKYIKDHELESDLKHTVKFIAFGSEETAMRGAKDYVTKHNDSENYSFVINPGNFGSYNRTGKDYYDKNITMNYILASREDWLAIMADEIADAMDYTIRSNLTGPGYIQSVMSNELVAEDSLLFAREDKNYVEDGVIQFRRSPFSGYHRDGENHTAGDIFSGLDNDTFELECEVAASVALHLLLNLDYQYENCIFTPVDLDGDGKNDSVNITVNMTTNNNATLFGKSTGGIYNSTTGLLSSDFVYTSLLPLSMGDITTTNITLTLLPNKPEGYYKANLSLFDPLGDLQDECNQTFYLYPINRPYANFGIGQSTGSKTITFFDSSIPSPNANEIDSWNWSFGDGEYSDGQNPSHTYDFMGFYDVTLTVVDDLDLSDSITKNIYAANNEPNANFQMDANAKVVNNDVTFTSTSSDIDGNIVNTKWHYGDGSTGYGSTTQHSYSRSDVYTVTMEVTDNDGSVNSTSDVVYIAGALVDDSYPGDFAEENKWDSIQDGINDIRDDELLYVFNGDYSGGLTVNKSISIYGEEGENTYLNCSGGTAVNIVNDSVLIDGLTIQNANIGIHINDKNSSIISNCNILNSNTGIKIESSAVGNIIIHSNFTNNTYGVFISGSKYNIIGSFCGIEQSVPDDNVFLLNDYGIYLENSDNNYIFGCSINATGYSDPGRPPPLTSGICLDNSDNNTIILCDIFEASNYGMYLGGSINNTITYCMIRENNKGLYLSGSSDNSIIMNGISENSFAGVSILLMSSTGNSVFWNDFIRNGQITRVQAEDFGTGNNWNSSKNITYMYNSYGEGNHWDDYTGTDTDGDNIGDTPYYITGTAYAQDDYPVMEEYGWLYN